MKGGEAQRFVQNLDIPGQWWTLFHSEALNTLVEQALKNNPTLPAAEAALRLAWENVYAAAGRVLPDGRSQLLAEPQQDRDRRRFHVGLLGQTLVHPPHCPGGRGLCAGRVRRHAAPSRVADGDG